MSTLAIVAVEPGRVARGIALALVAYAAFSTADALLKLSSAGFSVFQVAFVMAFFAMLPVLATTFGRGGLKSVLPRNVKLVAMRGILAAGCGTLAWNAFAILPMAEVYALLFAAPMLVTAFSALLLGEAVGWRRWSATIVGFIGVIIMIDPRFSGFGFGHLMAAMGAVAGALSFVILKKIGATEKSAAMLFSVLFWLMAVSFPPALASWVWPSAAELGIMAVAGLLMGVGQAGLVFATRDAPAVVVAPFQYSQMIWAVVFGVLVFGDVPTTNLFVGLAVVVAAGLFIIYRETVRAKAVTVGSGRGEVPARIARL
jgi:drug/metabolite transporter (DMT)-like permease